MNRAFKDLWGSVKLAPCRSPGGGRERVGWQGDHSCLPSVPASRGLMQTDFCEFEDSLVCIDFRSARTHSETLSQEKEKKKECSEQVSPDLMCTAMSGTSMLQTLDSGKAFFRRGSEGQESFTWVWAWLLTVCAENVPCSFVLPGCLQPTDWSPKEVAPTHSLNLPSGLSDVTIHLCTNIIYLCTNP